MKLNQDCVRRLLLTLEEINTPVRRTSISEIQKTESMKEYSYEDIFYTIQTLDSAHYIDAEFSRSPGGYSAYVISITWDGHEFLNTIRDEKVWKETKRAVNSFSSVSLEILSKTATTLITKLITQQFE